MNALWKLWKVWKLFFRRPVNIGLSERKKPRENNKWPNRPTGGGSKNVGEVLLRGETLGFFNGYLGSSLANPTTG
jgi:hypothetical protein